VRVLAADDDDALARVLERHLNRWGYDATIVRNGVEAWRILKREDCPRVVILDWDMPGLSGLEVCRLLRSTAHGASAYILLLTGRAEKEDLIQALESGADDFLSKPFHPRELQLRLAKGIRDAVRESEGGPLRSRPPPSGSILGGKYRLEKKIGEGGMGSVWLGVHLALGVNVAIKFMAKDLAEVPNYASFEREARAAAQLRDEHIVRVYDHGIDHDGLPYLVMEYLAGDSLTDWVDKRGTLGPSALASLVEQAARALTAAHARNVIHRDVKPENILMADDTDRAASGGFFVKLIDFGLARPYRAQPATPLEAPLDASTPAYAASGQAGTPAYMSPECLMASASPSPLLDLWGLAVTAFFAATGRLPFDSEDLGVLYRQICSDPLPSAARLCSAVPAGFDAWFERACARDPGARFQTAEELAAALGAACRDAEAVPTPSTPAERGPRSFAPTLPAAAPPETPKA
jgi:serine/threonine protein kinase